MTNIVSFDRSIKTLKVEEDLLADILNTIYEHSEKNDITLYQIYGCLEDVRLSIIKEVDEF